MAGGANGTVEITTRAALNRALDEELARDPAVFLLGEDIADPFGGSWKVTKGLSTKHGAARVRNTPISESAIVGAAVGAAMVGMRPVAEIMYVDFLALSADGLVNQAAKFRYMSGGQVAVPLVVRTQGGSGRSTAAQHGQSFESWFTHIPGLVVVMPSCPADAYGLLKSAIRDDNPVLFIEPKLVYGLKGPVPIAETLVPLGKAEVKRAGKDATIVATGAMVAEALKAAEALAAEGIEAEVIDPRTLVPLDTATILASVAKTSRVVIVHEASKRSGWGAEMAAVIAEEAFYDLDAPIRRVCGANAPIPAAAELEALHRPDAARIAAAVRESLG